MHGAPSRGSSWTRGALPATGTGTGAARGSSWTRTATSTRGSSWTRLAAVLTAAAATVVPLAGTATAAEAPARPAPVTGSAPAATYLVHAQGDDLTAVDRAVAAAGGATERRMPTLGTLSVRLAPAAVEALRRDPAVASVTEDRGVALASKTYDPATDPGSIATVQEITGVRTRAGKNTKRATVSTGAGVDVALIDSGVSPVKGLDDPDRILHGPDLSFESQDPALRGLDTYGHGTHMAGIILGADGGRSDGSDGTFEGLAPDARLVSLKVADARGMSDVTQVLAAIDWVVQHRQSDGLDIRVLNLSFGTDSTQDYRVDPLAQAVEAAWRAGIVVVTSAGNSGAASGRLTMPAADPFVLAVGATDTKGTVSTDDDVVPAFSSQGDGERNPDLVAPGAGIQSLRVPGSYLDEAHPAARLGNRFFRGSGTSQAAAVVTGAVATLLEQRPKLTPDEVKSLLVRTANPLPSADDQAEGAGLVDMRQALATAVTGNVKQDFPRSRGTGSLDASRGSAHLVLAGTVLSGQQDVFGVAYDAKKMASARNNGKAWTGGVWNGSAWAGSSWAGSSWAGSSWAGSSWAGTSWTDGDGGAAAGTARWTGSSWAGSSWAGSSWAGSSWAGSSWAGSSWAGSSWAGSSWASDSWG